MKTQQPVPRFAPAGRLAMVLWPVLQACTAADSGPPPVTQWDSAGIRIVESHLPAWGDSSRWLIDPESLVDLAESGTGDPHQFYSVRGMKRLSDGSIVVVNGGSDEIRQFSADGRFLGSAGGPGEGPGEFANIQQLELAGDSMLVLDYDGRVTVFGPGPTLIRTLRPHHGTSTIHYIGGGILVAQVLMSYSEATGLTRAPEALLLFDMEGVQKDSIGETAGYQDYSDGLTFSAAPLFGKAAHVDTHGDRIFYGAADLMQVDELAANGDVVRILRIPDFPLALTEEQVQAERNARLDMPLPQGMTFPPTLRRGIENMPSPASRPAYGSMFVDPSGAVWLRPFRGSSEGGGPDAWLVLDADGAWLGSVEIPAGFRVRDIGMDEVLGTWSDELDVQHPQVLRLTRGAAAAR